MLRIGVGYSGHPWGLGALLRVAVAASVCVFVVLHIARELGWPRVGRGMRSATTTNP